MSRKETRKTKERLFRRAFNRLYDIPNMSGRRIQKNGWGAGLNRHNLGEEMTTQYHYYVWNEEERGGPPSKETYPDCRQSKDQPFWVIRSIEPIDELTEIDYYIVIEFMKVGY